MLCDGLSVSIILVILYTEEDPRSIPAVFSCQLSPFSHEANCEQYGNILINFDCGIIN